jgi:hypothetical protein
MLEIDSMNGEHTVDELREDVSITGMNSTLSAFVPSDASVRVHVLGMNSTVVLLGEGAVSLSLEGMNTTARVSPALEVSASKSGMNATVERQPSTELAEGLDQSPPSSVRTQTDSMSTTTSPPDVPESNSDDETAVYSTEKQTSTSNTNHDDETKIFDPDG